MKHIKLFEEWSPNFNRTLQGAYGKAQSTNKGFGKATKAIMDYANRSISKKIFKVVTTREKEIEIVHHPEFILKPIDTFKKYNGELSKNKSFIVIPIKGLPSNAEKIGKFDGQIGPLSRFRPQSANVTTDFDLLFKDGKIYAMPASTAYTPAKREFSDLPEEQRELRFSSRVDIEDFFAMVIQAVLSSPEESSDIPGWGNPYGGLLDINLPGDTTEKQTILGLIKRLILDKDQRQYTM